MSNDLPNTTDPAEAIPRLTDLKTEIDRHEERKLMAWPWFQGPKQRIFELLSMAGFVFSTYWISITIWADHIAPHFGLPDLTWKVLLAVGILLAVRNLTTPGHSDRAKRFVRSWKAGELPVFCGTGGVWIAYGLMEAIIAWC